MLRKLGNIRVSLLLCLVVVAAIETPGAAATDGISPAVTAAIKDPGRPPEEIQSDKARKPAETLAFAGVKPGQVVVDFIPGDGYFTRLLSKAVGTQGKVYAYVPFAGAINADTVRRKYPGVEQPVDKILALENLVHYPNLLTIWQFVGLDGGTFAVPAQADVVLTANYPVLHDQKLTDTPGKDIPGVNKAVFRALKPGAVYVVSGARDMAGTSFARADTLGRAEEAVVKSELLAAGFVLDGESSALANASDDHTKPATADSDRFLLRFKKPANAPKDVRAQATPWMQALFGNTWSSSSGTEGERRHFYHPDGSYEELGQTESALQEGYWYIDANALTCILHQYPIAERAYTICSIRGQHKVGDKWAIDSRRGPSVLMLKPGIRQFQDFPVDKNDAVMNGASVNHDSARKE